jgi:hypothetical protein
MIAGMRVIPHHPLLPPLRIIFALLVLIVITITIAMYWPGMHGPMLLDDESSLAPVSSWLKGQFNWQRVVFGNQAGPLGRPISMATLLLDASVTHSTATTSFKPTNLAIHVLCGLAMLWLSVQVFRRWEPTRRHARWYALVLATAWLWLPLNVDTVLYIVQRMAQLATLFMLLALGCYMTARGQIAHGRRRGQLWLWVGVPVLTLLATFSKENGVLALPLALVLELFLFRDPDQSRPTSIKLFFALSVALPAVVGIAYVIVHPDFILGGYAGRNFTFTQRLLTEPRILWRYVQTLLVPLGRYMGFFQDNFPISTGALQPWTTLPALGAWIALAIIGWTWRKGNPLFGAGTWFYLIGQSLESSAIPLELYFEHRNYLPSFGVLLAVAGLLIWAWRRAPNPTRTFKGLCAALLACVLGLYAAATWGHVQSWRNERTFLYAQNIFNPTSPRFRSYIVALAIDHHDLAASLTFINIAEQDVPLDQRPATTLWRFLAYCSANTPPPAALYDEFARRAHGRISIPTESAVYMLAKDAEAKCPRLDIPRLATILRHWFDATPTSARAKELWVSRFALARILAAGGNLEEARDVAHRAWLDSGYDGVVGILLFQLNGSLGDVDACRKVLARLEGDTGHGNLQLDQAVENFRRALAKGEIGPPITYRKQP